MITITIKTVSLNAKISLTIKPSKYNLKFVATPTQISNFRLLSKVPKQQLFV